MHFALRNVTPFRFEDVFDWVLERDDVLVALEVHLLDERGQRGRVSPLPTDPVTRISPF